MKKQSGETGWSYDVSQSKKKKKNVFFQKCLNGIGILVYSLWTFTFGF